MLKPAVIVVRADSPFKTLGEFVDAAKAKPGALKQSGGSITSRDNIVRQQIEHATGVKWAYVSFPGGGERLAALLGGHVDMTVIEPEEAGEHVRAGKLRVLAQLTQKRLPGFPDVPTLKEAADAAAYWTDRFARLRETRSWQKYLRDNQLEDGFVTGAQFSEAIDATQKQLREQFIEAGIKVVR